MFIGNKIGVSLVDTPLTIDWSRVFQAESSETAMMYLLYIGTQEASADYAIGAETMDNTMSITSPKLVPPTTVYCVIAASLPSGAHNTYSETILL